MVAVLLGAGWITLMRRYTRELIIMTLGAGAVAGGVSAIFLSVFGLGFITRTTVVSLGFLLMSVWAVWFVF